MKFSYAVVMAALGLAESKRVSRKAAAQKRLLSKAIPVNRDGSIRKNARKLNDKNQNQYQVTAYDSISFTDCISLKVNSEDLQDETIYALAAEGRVVAQQSFVLFNIDTSGNEYYANESNLFMVPLADWLNALGQQGGDMEEQYCKACEKSYDYCFAEEEEEVEEEVAQDQAEDQGEGEGQDQAENQGEGEGQNRKRKLQKSRSKVEANHNGFIQLMSRKLENAEGQIMVECNTCIELGCFDEDDEEEEVEYCDQDNYVDGCTFDDDDLKQFIANNAFCTQTSQSEYFDGQAKQIYAGLMCNQYGTGVEMAMFLDEDCSLYDKSKSFKNTMAGTYLYGALRSSEDMIESPYKGAIDCMQYQFVQIQDENENNNNNKNNNNNNAQVNKVCINLAKQALDMDTCGGAEAVEEQEQQQAENAVDMSWYSYDIEANEEEANVCLKLQQANGEFGGYHVYENKNEYGGGGTFFEYNSSGSTGGMSAGAIVGIIAAVVVVVVAGVMIGQSFAKKNDSKKVPLVGNKTGAMA